MCLGVLRLPEKGYTYSQQLTLEFVKSQYGAVVMGVLVAPLFGLTLATVLAPLLASLYDNISAEAQKEVAKLPDLQKFLILAFPVLWVPILLPKKVGEEVTSKVAELNLGNRLFSGISLGGIPQFFR